MGKHVSEAVKMGGKDHAEDVNLGEGLDVGAVHHAHTKEGVRHASFDSKCQKTALADWKKSNGDRKK